MGSKVIYHPQLKESLSGIGFKEFLCSLALRMMSSYGQRCEPTTAVYLCEPFKGTSDLLKNLPYIKSVSIYVFSIIAEIWKFANDCVHRYRKQPCHRFMAFEI